MGRGGGASLGRAESTQRADSSRGLLPFGRVPRDGLRGLFGEVVGRREPFVFGHIRRPHGVGHGRQLLAGRCYRGDRIHGLLSETLGRGNGQVRPDVEGRPVPFVQCCLLHGRFDGGVGGITDGHQCADLGHQVWGHRPGGVPGGGEARPCRQPHRGVLLARRACGAHRLPGQNCQDLGLEVWRMLAELRRAHRHRERRFLRPRRKAGAHRLQRPKHSDLGR
mmetsp:Transcript_127513/g.366826  ORF Transcript_127513/g.366826 Transcript_127513/m.366826 type:complete len:222 (+) Transcript_127513:496-1161(+)